MPESDRPVRLRLDPLDLSRCGTNLLARVGVDDRTGKRVLVLVVEDIDRRIEETISGRSVHVVKAPAFPVSCVRGAGEDDAPIRVQLLVTAVKPSSLVRARRENRPASEREMLEGVPPPSWYGKNSR